MRLEIRDKDGKLLGAWVAKTSSGFNLKQKAEISKVRAGGAYPERILRGPAWSWR